MFDEFDTAWRQDESALRVALENWYEAMDGALPLRRALEALTEAFGADAAAVSRYAQGRGRPHLVVHDRRPPGAAVPGLARAYTHCVLGEFARRARPGSVWQSSMVSDLDPALTVFQKRRAMRELLVCPLGGRGGSDDYLELHFDHPVSGPDLGRITMAAVTLHRAWQAAEGRQFFDRVVDAGPGVGPEEGVDLLACDNPARLSRAEFRVCLLLSRGLSNTAVRGELKIANTTLRAHLRSIYCKTGVENKAELVFRLLSAQQGGTPVAAFRSSA
ncbi:response regulator transcription factor [Jannaschia seohaensis]|uniref:Regulatory LuxR family protein n=1 Tax=Jannaschia seohaensis TaxID=475081 RepID=A0A2Y9AJK6_9RHOB|nr:helix-turn-helix transcriptional regulator [Jannaschia seohaensis]PWJ20299.1 regulatory LuxR family protein [Jannaschia seohaensis]SSA44325.1 regulatory protein, luxR family [Jannaschia seohaensis]